ncbi:Transporter, MFS superfamily [Granulibacter bethesdensis]|uniref:Transporter, MFS superfamily n=1 Tax=Granulibacter bethesdensis TaxID=364410 RepID=A0AAC9KAL3_9PROT|nr:MFS transporter [Granulibacter bethesdensis]APH54189.1 Transporter, MFS superfamily [Granulibacter bethesdensis]APH61771.1 Transporter, MFS superfamily [Granulibacter bethesdensis]
MATTSLSRAQLLVMAVTTGTTIANIYYAQPILTQIGTSFGASAAGVGFLPALSQWSMALGILAVVPLGDMLDRKRLIVVLELTLGAVLIAMTATRDVWTAGLISLLIGVCTAAVQVVVPMAASLAAPNERGKVVGLVFTGTLIGILSSRIVSGLIADWIGWRLVYAMSGIAAIATAILVQLTLPSQRGGHRDGYASLLFSTGRQLARFPELRRLSLIGGLAFAAFCCFWTILTFQLSGPAFRFDSDRIGLFGIVAIGGALAAPWFGRQADRSSPQRAQLLTTGLLFVGCLVAALLPSSIAALIVATFVIDVGVQGTQVNNLAQLYGLDEKAHSRINAAFMIVFFVGGAIGTASGAIGWQAGGWRGAALALCTWSLAAFMITLYHERSSRRSSVRIKAMP